MGIVMISISYDERKEDEAGSQFPPRLPGGDGESRRTHPILLIEPAKPHYRINSTLREQKREQNYSPKSLSHIGVNPLARVRTLTLFARLDAKRKKSVLQFLYESRLIEKGKNIIDLHGADLGNADLRGAYLHGVDLSEADLNGANLCAAILSEADLNGANLMSADLSGFYLMSELSDPVLMGTNLSRANLCRADLEQANLWGANVWEANLREAILSGDNLS